MNAWTKVGQVVAGAALAFTITTAAPKPADAALYQVGFLLDSSGSITSSGWTLIRNGLANALPLFLAASDQYELTVMSFSSTTQTIVNKQIITSGNIATLQGNITSAPFLNANTNYQLAFNNISTVMSPSTSSAAASYLNFATDGDPNEGGGQAGGVTGRNNAIAAGIDNISIEGIGGSVNVAYLTGSICYPLACGSTSGFPGNGFYIAVSDAGSYASAVESKIRVITHAPEPASMVLLGSGLAGLGLLARRRRNK